MAKLLVLHGPNLNMLGVREPAHYGRASLQEINAHLREAAEGRCAMLECFQSNAEHELIDRILKNAKTLFNFSRHNKGAKPILCKIIAQFTTIK